jgi:hypothetical protein
MVNVRRAEKQKPPVRIAMPNIPIAVWLTRSVSTSTYVAGSMRNLQHHVSQEGPPDRQSYIVRIHTLPISLSTTPRPSASNTKPPHLGLREGRPDSDSSALATALALPVSSTHSPRRTLLLISCSYSCHSYSAPPPGVYSAALMRRCVVLRLAPLAGVECRLYSSSVRINSLAMYATRSSDAQIKQTVSMF